MLQVCKQQSEHQNPFVGENGVKFLSFTIATGSFDVAFDLLKYYPELASTTVPSPWTPLQFLMLSMRGKRYNFYQRFVYTYVPAEIRNLEDAIKNCGIENQETYQANLVTKSFIYSVMEKFYVKFWKVTLLQVPHIKQLHKDKVNQTLALTILKFICEEIHKLKSNHIEQLYDACLAAMLNDTPEVIELIARICPQLVWARDSQGCSLIGHSIVFRSKYAYNFLMHQVSPDKYFYIAYSYNDGNNLLHLAGKRAFIDDPNGAALQMQRDLQWFQEVSNFVRPEERTVENFEQETPLMLFKKEHKDLRQQGEKWVKNTARSYTVTAAFIFAIALVAALTVPGGNNKDTGKAVDETVLSFIIFAVSDVMSMIISGASLLLFRSFDTARYADEDFLYNLPKSLILGLVMLFMSVATMLIAFSATLYIMFALESSWILILVAAIACLPIALFVTLQLPLLVELISSTYACGTFGKRRELAATS
ncbi:putative PGG domain-containing protein [Helianthus debilis subsp. tardiflorus]